MCYAEDRSRNGTSGANGGVESGGVDDGRPLEESDDDAGCPPPDDPIMVYCLHCGKEYMSSEMVPPKGRPGRERTEEMMEGLWWCATPGCNAGGFGLDVFPVDPEWKDPKGLLRIIVDDDDDDEDEDEGKELAFGDDEAV